MSACPSRKPSTSNTGCSRRPSCSACRSRRALAGRIALVTGGAGGIGRATAARLLARRRLRRARRHRRGGARRRRQTSSPRPTARTASAASSCDVTDEDAGRSTAFAETAVEFGGIDILVSNAGIASVGADRGHDAGAVEQEHGHPGDRLFPGLARGLPADASAEASAASIVFIASQERPRRLAQRRRPIAPPRRRKSISRAAWRWKARRAASASTSSIPTPCCAARRSGPASGASSAPPPTRSTTDELEEHYRQRSHAEALGASRGHRRGGLFLRLRHVGQIDRQHHQCRRRQRRRASRARARTRENHGMTDRSTDDLIAERQREARRPALTARLRVARRAARPPRHRHRRHHATRSRHSRVAIPSWGVGTGGTRFARFPGAGRAARHLRQARGLRRHPAADAGDADGLAAHPVGQGATRTRLKQAAAQLRPRLRRHELQHLPGSARTRSSRYKFGCCRMPTRRRATQAVEHNLECIEIGKTLGSKALTVWIGDGSNFPGQVNFAAAFERYLDAMQRDLCRRCRRTGRSSPSTRCTSRPSIRPSIAGLGHQLPDRAGARATRRSAWSTSATMRPTSTSR